LIIAKKKSKSFANKIRKNNQGVLKDSDRMIMRKQIKKSEK
jgi:hypothetical protein